MYLAFQKIVLCLGLLILICNCSEKKESPIPEMIDLDGFIPNITFDVRYATPHNFTGQQVYDTVRVFLVKDAALALKEVALNLEKIGYGLRVYDAYRPLSVQRKFWKIFPNPDYVADPKNGSRHNRGAAIDLTLYSLESGDAVEMPTDFDDFTEKAHHSFMNVSTKALENRSLLKTEMEKHGFVSLDTEWWHYDFNNWKNYPVLDVDFWQIDKKIK